MYADPGIGATQDEARSNPNNILHADTNGCEPYQSCGRSGTTLFPAGQTQADQPRHRPDWCNRLQEQVLSVTDTEEGWVSELEVTRIP